jgi:UDP-N-acetylglucosamine 2-epimerase (non-hydrolysing)
MSQIALKNDKFILVTAHRRESFGKKFQNICEALVQLIDKHNDVDIVYPVHLNPNIKKPVERFLGKKDRLHLISPLDYVSFVTLMNESTMILTDSGGIQEEAPSLGKAPLVMREVTEREEAIKSGTAKLVGTDKNQIVAETERLLNDKTYYQKCCGNKTNPYGDGQAAQRIASWLLKV